MDFAWLTIPPQSEVIDPGHPDYEYWAETEAMEALIAGEEPEPPSLPRQPKPTEVPAVALALSKQQAAEALNASVDYFDKHVMPDLRVVSRGRRVLIPVRELEAWVERHAARALKA